MFPDKTSQVWKLPQDLIDHIKQKYSHLCVVWEFENEGEFMPVCQLAKLIRQINRGKNCNITLHCPYLPYGRQDKAVSNDSCFALHVFCELVEVYFDRLSTFDVHNPDFFTPEKMSLEVNNIMPVKELADIVANADINFVVLPDKTAALRYGGLIDLPHVAADKVREPLTGEITGISVPEIKNGLNILVADDIADGAKTMIELAKIIGPASNKLILYVSHGLFTKGTKIVYDSGYENIYTKDGLLKKP